MQDAAQDLTIHLTDLDIETVEDYLRMSREGALQPILRKMLETFRKEGFRLEEVLLAFSGILSEHFFDETPRYVVIEIEDLGLRVRSLRHSLLKEKDERPGVKFEGFGVKLPE